MITKENLYEEVRKHRFIVGENYFNKGNVSRIYFHTNPNLGNVSIYMNSLKRNEIYVKYEIYSLTELIHSSPEIENFIDTFGNFITFV